MSTSSFQIRILEVLFTEDNATIETLLAYFGEEAFDEILTLMEHGLIVKVGLRNRFANPTHLHDGMQTQVRTRNRVMGYIKEYYSRRGTSQAFKPLSRKLESVEMTTPFVCI